MAESLFERKVIKKLERMFPGCVILKNDPRRQQGICDRLILWNDMWAMLEFKASATAEHQPNQDYYVQHYGGMSFAAFIYPENEEEVLVALQEAFASRGATRVSQP